MARTGQPKRAITILVIYSHMFEEAGVKSCDAITNALGFKKQPPEDKKSAV